MHHDIANKALATELLAEQPVTFTGTGGYYDCSMATNISDPA
jgi:hypothetical protein